MRENEILNALNFLNGEKVKDVPEDQRFKFLEDKLTQEELVEVKKRFKKKSEVVPRRLETINNHFMTAINIASLAVLTSIGVNYMMDNVKEKKDQSLREEIRDRMQSCMKEMQDRLKSVETDVQKISSRMCDAEEVEEIVGKRIEQYEANNQITDVKNKTLNLKVRSVPDQKAFQLGIQEVNQLDQLRTELVAQLQSMREDLASVNKSNQQCIQELTQMQINQKQENVVRQEKVIEVVAPLESVELTQEEKINLAQSVDKFVGSFTTSEQQNLAVTRFCMPLSQISKNPSQEKWRTVLLNNALIKQVVQNNQQECEQFLVQIGFNKIAEQNYKFEGLNLKVLEECQEMMKERLNKGSIEILKDQLQQ